jgi:hypothetical protein
MLLVFIGRRPTSVMRKESRDCAPRGAAARFRMVQSDGDSKRPQNNLTPSWVPIATLHNLS